MNASRSHTPARSLRRILLAVVLVLVSAGVLAGGLWYWNRHRPLPEPRTATEALEHIGTARFERLPEARQRQYMDKARSLMRDLPREQRRRLREKYSDSQRIRDSMQQRFQRFLVDRALEYNRASPQQRSDMSQRFGPRARRGGENQTRRTQPQSDRHDNEGGSRRGDRAHRRERMESFMEEGNPQTGALIGEMFRHLRGEAK